MYKSWGDGVCVQELMGSSIRCKVDAMQCEYLSSKFDSDAMLPCMHHDIAKATWRVTDVI